MKIFTPRWKYQAVSITGNWCALNCSYCKGRYLRGMIHVNPDNITDVLAAMWRNGVRGVLISGGFDKDGKLPVEPYIDKLREIKRETGLFMSIHLGLMKDESTLSQLVGAVDLVDYELLWSREMINFVKNLEVNKEDFKIVLERTRETGLEVVPHIYVWHPWITREELREELEYLDDLGLERIILLIYIPPGREDQSIDPELILGNVRYLRERFDGEIYMGCMRPWFTKRSIDRVLFEESLVDRVVNPHGVLIKDKRLAIYDACCSIPEDKLEYFTVDQTRL